MTPEQLAKMQAGAKAKREAQAKQIADEGADGVSRHAQAYVDLLRLRAENEAAKPERDRLDTNIWG